MVLRGRSRRTADRAAARANGENSNQAQESTLSRDPRNPYSVHHLTEPPLD